ncbi:MAG TPA: ABC transporter ATP-binding protein [Limnochordales bacterium]
MLRDGARSGTGRAPAIRLDNVTKQYGAVGALRGLSLEVAQGEFFSLLGPSGCGKTTTLRIIAGLLEPDSGRVYLDGRDVTDLPPYRRNLGLVFQNYALFPHMTVWDNVAYGLRARRMPEREVKARVGRYLEIVGLSAMANRRPRELSGGQQQRVALARSLAIEPVVLLFDEPLSNLDAQLREQMQVEIRQLQRELGFTAFYVTHDQAEALLLSDRLAVLREGRLEQLGTPEELYDAPASPFVAAFFGGTNLLEGTAVREGSGWRFRTPGGSVFAAGRAVGGVSDGAAARLAVRPQRIRVAAAPSGTGAVSTGGASAGAHGVVGNPAVGNPAVGNPAATGNPIANGNGVVLAATVETRLYLGDQLEYRLRLASGERLTARVPVDEAVGTPGDTVAVIVPAAACTLFGPEV